MITFLRLGTYGRLGNQMFQYAALLGIEAVTGFEAGIPPDGTRGLQLASVFRIRCPRTDSRCRPAREWREPGFEFQPSVFSIEDDTDLVGYFQSQRYFEHIAERIRTEFSFLPEIDSRAQRSVEAFCSQRSPLVSLHVCRGDYVSLTDCHHMCGLSYYEAARALCPLGAFFVICSDDPEWCRDAFRDWNASICDADDATTLAIMSLCDCNIIAASSFSWWGAWLNSNAHKRVIAPRT